MAENYTAIPAAAEAFSAETMWRRITDYQTQRAADEVNHRHEQEEKEKAIIAEVHKPPTRTPEQEMQMVTQLVTHAAKNGRSEVQIYTFPAAACTDLGRRINNALPDWEVSLEGRPKFAYDFWRDQLRPLGFCLRAEVLNYPGGMPGEIGFFLSWKKGA